MSGTRSYYLHLNTYDNNNNNILRQKHAEERRVNHQFKVGEGQVYANVRGTGQG